MTEKQEETGLKQTEATAGKVEAGESKPMFSEETLNFIRIAIGIALLIPILQLYFTIPSAINMWVADQYVPFVNMIYFIIIIIGGVWLFRYTFTLSGSGKGK